MGTFSKLKNELQDLSTKALPANQHYQSTLENNRVQNQQLSREIFQKD
jgi:hypothetical protein